MSGATCVACGKRFEVSDEYAALREMHLDASVLTVHRATHDLSAYPTNEWGERVIYRFDPVVLTPEVGVW